MCWSSWCLGWPYWWIVGSPGWWSCEINCVLYFILGRQRMVKVIGEVRTLVAVLLWCWCYCVGMYLILIGRIRVMGILSLVWMALLWLMLMSLMLCLLKIVSMFSSCKNTQIIYLRPDFIPGVLFGLLLFPARLWRSCSLWICCSLIIRASLEVPP